MLAAMASNTGAIQDGLAAAASAAMAQVAANTKKIKRTLNGRKSAAVQFINGQTGQIATVLGQTAANAIAQSQSQTQILQNAAVGIPVTLAPATGAPPDSLPSGGGGVSGGAPMPAPAPTLPNGTPLWAVLIDCNASPPKGQVAGGALVQQLMAAGYVAIFTGSSADVSAYVGGNGGIQNIIDSTCPQSGGSATAGGGATSGGSAVPQPGCVLPVGCGITSTWLGTDGSQIDSLNFLFTVGVQYTLIAFTWGTAVYKPTGTWTFVARSPDGQPDKDCLIQRAIAAQGLPADCGVSPVTTPTNPVTVPTSPLPIPTSPGCPPPPACPAATTPVTPSSGCAITLPELTCAVAPDGKLPPVGSEQWCACLQSVIDWLAGIGDQFASFLDNVAGNDTQGGTLGAMAQVFNKQFGSLSPFFDIANLQTIISNSDNDIQCAYSSVVQLAEQLGDKVGGPLLGLSLARTLLGILKRLRFGWDIAVWITLDIDIEIRPLSTLLDYCEHYVFPWELPAVGDSIECYLKQTAPVEQIKCWMSCQGANFDIFYPVIDARRERLSVEEWIQYQRRIGEDDPSIANTLPSYGFIRDEDIAGQMEMSYELPSISDHLHWLQRNVFDDAYVQQYSLLEGFDTKFWPKFGDQLHALGMREEYAQLHYAAHWVIPSVGQLEEMMFRLRPGRVDPSIQFTKDDLINLLAEQDVAPWYRPRLSAIAFRTIPLRQLNQAAQSGAFDHTEMVARYQDIGYSAADAETLATSTEHLAARQLASASHGYTAALVSELAQYGQISKADANAYLNPQGFDAAKVDQLFTASADRRILAERKKHDEGTVNDYAKLALAAYEDGSATSDGARSALLDAGYSARAADLAIQTADLRVRKATIDAAAASVHKAFRYGAVDAVGATTALLAAGITQTMAGVYVQRWQLEMSVPRLSASSAAVLRWAKKGIMSVANARIRLVNLGWSPGDADLNLAEIEQAIRQAQQLAAQKRAKALAQAQKAAQSAIKAAQKESCRVYSAGKMIRWYALRIIDDATFTARLTQCGYDAVAITGLLREAEVARAAKDVSAAKKGSAGVEYTGPGAVAGGPSA